MLRSDDEAAASDPKRPFSPYCGTGISCAHVLLLWPVPIFVMAAVTGALIRGNKLRLPLFIIIIIIGTNCDCHYLLLLLLDHTAIAIIKTVCTYVYFFQKNEQSRRFGHHSFLFWSMMWFCAELGFLVTRTKAL
jgi:hypothetical protein